MKGFLLGLTSGTICLTCCAPILVPYLLGEGKSVRQNMFLLVRFLVGRLSGYLLFGVLAWTVNLFIGKGLALHDLLFGTAYLILAAILIIYGFFNKRSRCEAKILAGLFQRLSSHSSSLLPLFFGLLTGINLCPPFLLAFTEASGTSSIGGSLWFFWNFFLGTSLFFLPIPFLGVLRRFEPVQIVGKLAAGILGVYYLYIGTTMIQGGLIQL